MEALVSIIIPIYNVEAYLDECIRSAAEQTYRNLEILLLDDGSTDGSGAICDAWRAKDARIRVFHTENGGVAAARNLGLAEARGEFVAFLDSDDRFNSAFIASMMGAVDEETDIVVSRTRVLTDDMREVISTFPKGEGRIGAEEAMRRLMMLDGMYNGLCDKLCRRRVLEGIRFPEGRIYEDCARVYQIIGKARVITYADGAVYDYRHREGSVTWRPYGPHNLDLIEQWIDRYRDICRDWPSAAPDANMAYLAELTIAWRNTKKYQPPEAEAMKARILACWRAWRAMPNRAKGLGFVRGGLVLTGRNSLSLICWILDLLHYEFRDVATW